MILDIKFKNMTLLQMTYTETLTAFRAVYEDFYLACLSLYGL